MSKGSNRRPRSPMVTDKQVADNWDLIFNPLKAKLPKQKVPKRGSKK